MFYHLIVAIQKLCHQIYSFRCTCIGSYLGSDTVLVINVSKFAVFNGLLVIAKPSFFALLNKRWNSFVNTHLFMSMGVFQWHHKSQAICSLSLNTVIQSYNCILYPTFCLPLVYWIHWLQ